MKDQHIRIENHVVLFMDIHDYSIVMSMLGRNKSCSFLQEVYEKLGDIIVEYRGEIVKYMGDAILCVFPAYSENQVIECSLKLRKVFSNIVRERNISHDTELEIGIGSGDIEIGMFGHKSLMQRGVFGEEVNRTAVIGHHKGIAITEKVYEKVKTNYKTNKLPEFRVKWQSEPLKVWEIVE
jgi:adenylate cyclase